MYLKNKLYFIIVFLFLVTSSVISSEKNKVLISNSTNSIQLIVDLAVTNQEKSQGLMYIKKLTDSNGMLFVYKNPKILSMWMKDTFVDLDIIFLDKDRRVTDIKKGNRKSLKIISSLTPSIAVLELPYKCSQKLNIKKGDKFNWKPVNYYSMINLELEKNLNFFPCIKN